MKIFKISLLLLTIILILFCCSNKVTKTQIISKDGLEILYGEISKDQLFYDFPEWKNIYNTYKVNHSIMDSISNVDTNMLEVEIYLGTWCGDSKREVPRFLKILTETEIITNNKIRLFAVDRKKKLKSGLAELNYIERVATFIIKNKLEEIGRIVEIPEKSLESDLVKILRNQ
jgi:thioredoxin family protein